MGFLFGLLGFISVVWVIFGLVKPTKAAPFLKSPSRLKILGIFFILVVIIGVLAPKSEESSAEKDNNNASTTTVKSEKKEEEAKYYRAGQYKIPNDLPAGEYVVIADGNSYIEVTKDSTGSFDSIIANDMFKNRSIISVKEGQYLKVQNGKIYEFSKAPKVKDKEGLLSSGMYKVGVDFPAGEYKVISKGRDSYIEISSTSSHQFDDILSNDLFQGDRYIKVSDGQYLKFFNCEIKIK